MQVIKQRRRTPLKRQQASGLEFRHLRAFVALIDHGSITAAAQALGLAQSTVSESLAALERALGTPVTLRRRGAQDVLLTPAGQAMLPHARKMLDSLDDAYMDVAGVTNDAHATLQIITNESISAYLLPEVLATLRARWVNTRFAVSVATCPGVRAGINDGEFDIGILLEVDEQTDQTSASAQPATASASDRTVVADNLALVVFARKTHVLASTRARTTVRCAELVEYPLFMSDAAGDFHALIRRFFESDGVPAPHLDATGTVEGVKRGVLTDACALGILPEYALVEEIQKGQVVALSFDPAPPRMRIEVIVSLRRPRHPAVVELIDSLRLELKRERQSLSA
jgi:DNA-binding transcriptional LysR family regulator